MLPLPPSPLLRTISTDFILLISYMDTNHIHHPFLVPSPLPLVLTTWKHLFSSCPSFFKIGCILIVQGEFALILQGCIYRAFIKCPPLLTHCLSPCSPNIQQWIQLNIQFNVCIISYSYIDELFQYFSFSNIFFLYPTSLCPLRQTHYLFCHYMYIYDHICFDIYI
jgi:hypothetical protein